MKLPIPFSVWATSAVILAGYFAAAAMRELRKLR
jgi:hypothetical protein